VEVFCQCISLELGRPSNPCDTERYALNKELFHCSARLVLALELPTQELVTSHVIDFADPFRGKPMFACILVVGECRQLIILRHAGSFEISNCPAFDDAGEYINRYESDNKTFPNDRHGTDLPLAEWAGRMFVGLAALAPQRRPVRVASSRISDALPISVLTFFNSSSTLPQPSQPKIARIASSGLCALIAFIS
jgi:hypothetical protein